METETLTEGLQPGTGNTVRGKISSLPRHRVFWMIIIAAIGAAILAWICLHDVDREISISIPSADEVYILSHLGTEADFEVRGDGQAFFDLRYKILLVGSGAPG